MSSADGALQRAHACLEDAKDPTLDSSLRLDALDSARAALLEARRARASSAHLEPVFTSLLTAASSDRSHIARSIVPQAVEDLCLRDLRAFIPAATPFLSQALQDRHVLVAARALRALTTLFRKTIGCIVSVGVGEHEPFFPEAHLATWLQMQQKAISLIHVQDEGLRKAAVKFAETVVLAFSYSGGPGSADHFTIDYIMKKGSNSPLLDVRTLEEEGIRCVRFIAQLVLSSLEGAVVTSKPDSSESVRGLPPASFMTAISVLGNLVRRRRKLIEVTLPPFLRVIPAVIGTAQPPCIAMQTLSEGQKQSIIAVLRFNLAALRGYSHVRVGRVGMDIAQATNDLAEFEKREEMRRKEEATAKAAMERRQKAEASKTAEAEKRRVAAQAQPNMSQKRPRGIEPGASWPRLPPKEAFALSQTIIQSMPPQEVVNFIMTRLLLNIPAENTIPGAQQANQRSRNGLHEAVEEPVSKRPRKSRFGTKAERVPDVPPPVVAPVVAPKKAAVRKTAPSVVPARLSASQTEKLVLTCSRRIMTRVTRAVSSGAGPLRIQLLARLLSRMARSSSNAAQSFCDEACKFIVEDISQNMPLAQAWLFSLVCDHEIVAIGHKKANLPSVKNEPSTQADDTVRTDEAGKSNVEENRHGRGLDVKQENMVVDGDLKDRNTENVVSEVEGQSAKSEVPEATNNNGDTNNHQGDELHSQGEQNGGDKLPDSHTNGEANDDVEQDIAMKELESTVEELEEDPHEPFVENSSYERILLKLVDCLQEGSSVASEAFSDLITEAPMLPTSVIDNLKKSCHSPASIKLGLNTIHDVIVKRPGDDRQTCTSILLDLCSNEDEVLRGPAIRLTANKVFVECSAEVAKTIQTFALNSLRGAIQHAHESETNEILGEVERKSLLPTALCGQKHEILKEVALLYKLASQAARKILLLRAKDLGAHLGQSAVPVIQLISGDVIPTEPHPSKEGCRTDELEGLALEMLKAILQKFGKPTTELVQAAQKRYGLCQETDFLIAVLPGLSRDALLTHLSAIVSATYRQASAPQENGSDEKQPPTDEAQKTAAFKEVISLIMGGHPPAVSPAELLVELHNIEPTAAVSNAIRACFELKSVYKQEAIAQAIQQLIEKTTIPDFFMRTVHLARLFYPEREKYLTGTVMKRLIQKQVWKNEVLWEGYLLYCAEVKEKSLRILLSLPVAQLEDALQKQPGLCLIFKELVANPKNAQKIQVKHRKVIEAAIKKAPTS